MPLRSAEDCETRLQKLNAEFEEFAYIVSHDLKAPVRAVNNLATWLEEDLEGNLPGDCEQNFKTLKNRLGRLDSMIQALLDYSRISRMDLQIEPVQVEETIKNIVRKLDQEKPIKLNIQGTVSEFNTYAAKLTAVLQNLLHNAHKFNDKPETEIDITLAEESNFVTISVADNGPGIPASGLNKIFTIFYTVQPKDTLETTGAGLAIANKIINFVGGDIAVENQVSGGAKFTIRWPKQLDQL